MRQRFPWSDLFKFLSGAFFVSAGILFYLYKAHVAVPLLGTDFIVTPEISGQLIALLAMGAILAVWT